MAQVAGAVFIASVVFATFQIVRLWVLWELLREEED